MKFIDFFAGVGGFRRGMELAGHECVGFCEWDKYATASYTSMHLITDEQRNYLATLPIRQRQKEILKEEYRNGEWYANDIRTVDAGSMPKADCWCGGFPCQDISVAGKQAGLSGERSGLFFQIIRLLEEREEKNRPEWILLENVKNLLSIDEGWGMFTVLSELDKVGYDCQWQVCNSKIFGVPQNRERVFIVGHLRGRGSRKVFPVEGTDGTNSIHIIGHRNGYRRNTQVFDADGITEALDTAGGGGRGHHTAIKVIAKTNPDRHSTHDVHDPSGIMSTCLGRDYKQPKQVAVMISPDDLDTNKLYNQRGVVHSPTGVARTMNASHSGNEPKVAIPVSFARGETVREIDTAHCLSAEGPAKEGMRTHQSMNRVVIPVLTPEREKKRQNGRRFKENGDEAFTLTAQDRHGVAIGVLVGEPDDKDGIYVELSNGITVHAIWYPKYKCYIAIRKLTPKECFRLQGWTDDYFNKAEFVNSDSQLYKQAGNGVTVSVIEAIGRKMRED